MSAWWIIALLAIYLIADGWSEKLESDERIVRLNSTVEQSKQETLRLKNMLDAFNKEEGFD